MDDSADSRWSQLLLNTEPLEGLVLTPKWAVMLPHGWLHRSASTGIRFSCSVLLLPLMRLATSLASPTYHFLALLPVGSACAQHPSSARMQPYQTEKFKLSAGPCAADGYWVTIQSATFRNSLSGGFPVPGGHTLEGNWGASGT